jgi:hypothetical protein
LGASLDTDSGERGSPGGNEGRKKTKKIKKYEYGKKIKDF